MIDAATFLKQQQQNEPKCCLCIVFRTVYKYYATGCVAILTY